MPGVPEGVEGAPLSLDGHGNILSMQYTNNARLKIQNNFTAPPDVNDPNLTCVVEWKIQPNGAIEEVRVKKSSGVLACDSCAVDALKKTANLGPLPSELGSKPIWTSLTFYFAGDAAPQ